MGCRRLLNCSSLNIAWSGDIALKNQYTVVLGAASINDIGGISVLVGSSSPAISVLNGATREINFLRGSFGMR
jgi:hypothetical protein